MISTPYPFHPDIEKYVSFLRIPTEAEISDFNYIITFLFFYVQFNPPVFLGPKWERIWSSYLSLIFLKYILHCKFETCNCCRYIKILHVNGERVLHAEVS